MLRVGDQIDNEMGVSTVLCFVGTRICERVDGDCSDGLQRQGTCEVRTPGFCPQLPRDVTVLRVMVVVISE